MRLRIVSDVLIDENNNACKTYGIIIDDDIIVSDITTDYFLISQLVEMLESSDIEKCHCMDVIEDFLCDKSTICILRK